MYYALQLVIGISLFLLTAQQKIKPRVHDGFGITVEDSGGFAVQIYVENTLLCTGSLLSDRYIITAAHCFNTAPRDLIHVVAGESVQVADILPEYKNFISRVMIHPDFNEELFVADIAVVKTKRPIEGDNIKYAQLCTQFLLPDEYAFAFGWGGVDDTPRTSYQLRHTRVSILSKAQCNDKLQRIMPPTVICAWGNDGRTTCKGDSGGPLVYNFELCGIISAGWGCGNTVNPDLYMSILSYKPFIEDALKTMNEEEE